jgi:ABC-2 type transport system permease protein
MRDLLAVAEKELRDYFTGKRFILLFAVILFLCIAGVALSLNSYNEQLISYKAAVAGQSADQYHLQQIKDQQKLIDDAEARGDSPEHVGELKAGLQALTNPPMPSVLPFINGVGIVFVTMGALMAIIMGYGLITREKETGTIKLVLTRPMYRDSLINGKAIAGFTTIAVIFGASFLVILAIMLVYNIVPGSDELLRILALFLVILLYMLLFFSISLLISTVSPSSTVALLASVGVFILALILFGVGAVAGYFLAGPMPEMPATIMNGPPVPEVTANTSSGHSSGYSTGSGGVSYYISGYNESDPQVIAYRQAMADYDKELKVYYARQQQISDAISIFSPISNFYKLNEVLTSKYVPGQQSYSIYGSYFYTYGTSKELNVFESLAYRWTYLLIFIVEIIAAFGLSYMLFMRADVT